MKPCTAISYALSGLLVAGSASAQNKPAAAAKPQAAAAQNANLEKGIEAMFKAVDTDKNGSLSFQEFQAAVIAERRQALIIQQLQQKFRAADADKNGSLNNAEFSKLPAVAKSSDPKPAFAAFDSNKDQAIDFREYLLFVQQISRPKPTPTPVK